MNYILYYIYMLQFLKKKKEKKKLVGKKKSKQQAYCKVIDNTIRCKYNVPESLGPTIEPMFHWKIKSDQWNKCGSYRDLTAGVIIRVINLHTNLRRSFDPVCTADSWRLFLSSKEAVNHVSRAVRRRERKARRKEARRWRRVVGFTQPIIGPVISSFMS